MNYPYLSFNGEVAPEGSTQIGMNLGTYTFTGITSSHPFGIYISDENMVKVTSGTVYSKSGGNTYYTGTVVVDVKANFGTASYGCSKHGYMGGEDRLVFNSDCATASPTATPTASPTAAPTSAPSAIPTAEPTASPTSSPTATPTA